MLYKGIYKSFYWVSPLFIVALIAIAKKEDKFKKNKVVENIYWYWLKMYTKCEETYSSYKKFLNNYDTITIVINGVEIIENTCKSSTVADGIISHDMIIDTLTNKNILILSNCHENYDMILYKTPCKKDKYDYLIRRINNLDNDYIIKPVKPCIVGAQIEVEIEEGLSKSLTVDLETNNYYLENNILFDEKFVNYWLNKYYNITNFKNYKVSFFNRNNMEMVYLEKGDYITITSDGFIKTKKDDDFEHLIYEER